MTVDYATVNGTASDPSDYTAASGTLTFAAGTTGPQTITVTIKDDDDDEEESEMFTVRLSNASNATLSGGGQTLDATVTIDDNDDPWVTVRYDDTFYSGERGCGDGAGDGDGDGTPVSGYGSRTPVGDPADSDTHQPGGQPV